MSVYKRKGSDTYSFDFHYSGRRFSGSTECTSKDEDTGEQVWSWVDTGKPCKHSCLGWMPLPEPLQAPVLSELRPDGFDGPTGAE